MMKENRLIQSDMDIKSDDRDIEISEITPLYPTMERLISNDTPLPKGKLMGYAVGGLGLNTLSNLIAVYYTIFLLEIAKIHPTSVSLILLAGKGLNALSDPLVGYLVSQSHETRFGKFSPWMLISLPFLCGFYFSIWFVPSSSESVKVAYFFIVYCLMNISRACFVIPYVSSVLSISSNQQQRDSLVAYRVMFDIFGSILGMSIHAIYLFLGFTYDWDKTTPYIFTATTSSCLMLIVGFIAFMSIEERFVLDHGRGRWGPVCTPYVKVFKFKPYVLLLFCLLFGFLGYQVLLSIYALYFKYVLNAEKIFPICTVIIYVCASISIVGWKRLATFVGKKSALTISTLLIMVLCWLHLFLEKNTAVIIIVCVLLGCLSACSVQFVPASMIPDVIAAYSLKNGHGEEAMFYSITYFIETMSLALCSAMSTMVLEAAGYDSNNVVQPDGVLLALKFIIGGFSVLCFLVSLIFLWEYPITEKLRKEMRHAIKQSMVSISKK